MDRDMDMGMEMEPMQEAMVVAMEEVMDIATINMAGKVEIILQIVPQYVYCRYNARLFFTIVV